MGAGNELAVTGDKIAGAQLRAIAEDREGTLWVGTREGGVSAWRDGKFTTFGPGQGLPGADEKRPAGPEHDGRAVAGSKKERDAMLRPSVSTSRAVSAKQRASASIPAP